MLFFWPKICVCAISYAFSFSDCNGIRFDDHHIDYDQYIDDDCYDGYDDDSDDNFL